MKTTIIAMAMIAIMVGMVPAYATETVEYGIVTALIQILSDLTITKVDAKSVRVPNGYQTTIGISLKNIGGKTTGSPRELSVVDATGKVIGKAKLTGTNSRPMTKGQTLVYSAQILTKRCGERVTVQVDSAKEIEEANENNNAYSFRIAC